MIIMILIWFHKMNRACNKVGEIIQKMGPWLLQRHAVTAPARCCRKGLESLVRRYQSGDLQESLEKRFSVKHIKDVEGELERGIEKVGNATQKVLEALSRNNTSIKGIEDALNDTGLLTHEVVKAGHSSEQKNLRH